MRTITCALLVATATAVWSPCAFARPIVIEDSTRIVNPAPDTWRRFGDEVALNGEYALIGSADERYGGGLESILRAAHLYRLVGSQWLHQGVLDQVSREPDSYVYNNSFAMRGALAVVGLDGRSHVYRLANGTWQRGEQVAGANKDTETDGIRFVHTLGDCDWHARVFDPAPGGGFTGTFLEGQPRDCDDEFWGGPVDMLGTRVIIGTPYTRDLEDQEVPIYQRTASGWALSRRIVSPEGSRGFSGEVLLNADEAIVDSTLGGYLYPLQDYTFRGRIRAADVYSSAFLSGDRGARYEQSEGRVFIRERNADRGVSVINVFHRLSQTDYRHVAVLAARNGGSLGESFDVVGNTVIASGTENDAYVFELPASLEAPAPRFVDFEPGNDATWTSVGAAQFSVVPGAGNRVYRQSNDTGDARALLEGASWRDQAMEADVTPTWFNGSDRWVGLVTRYQDAQNFYYVTLRSSGSVQLRRMTNGAFAELASAPLTVSVNRTYRLRLESIGSNHKVYVDGELALDVDDSSLLSAGRAGLAMYRTRADFDNVSVTPSPLTSLFRHDFSTPSPGFWEHSGNGQWNAAGGVYSQDSVAGDARAVTGTPVEDQVVRARMRPTAFAAGNPGQERWAGLIARFVDTSNYYYLTVRNSNNVSLRKLVNGGIVTLASTPLPVALGATYDLRLEAVGTQIRAYVDGRLLLQANDSSHARGAGGLVTWRTAAQFDDYRAYQP